MQKKQHNIVAQQYNQLISDLLQFKNEHDRIPSASTKSCASERKLYFKWICLKNKKTYVSHFSEEDKRKLSEAGYSFEDFNNTINGYKNLYEEIINYIRINARLPRSIRTFKRITNQDKYEHNLAQRYYRLLKGDIFIEFFTSEEANQLQLEIQKLLK